MKNGDGAADFKPIAHLYKSQVYQLASYLGGAGGSARTHPHLLLFPSGVPRKIFFSCGGARIGICVYGVNIRVRLRSCWRRREEGRAVEGVYGLIDGKQAKEGSLPAQGLMVDRAERRRPTI